MAITKLTVENFKSFDKLEVELRPFNIVVGSNASGKSNFLDVFRFLRDIEASSLENAIGIRGGSKALRNVYLEKNQPLCILVETDDVQRHLVSVQADGAVGIRTDRTTYDLTIRFNDSEAGFEVASENLTENFTIFELGSPDGQIGTELHVWRPRFLSRSRLDPRVTSEWASLGTGRTVYFREDSTIKCRVELPEGLPFTEHDLHHLHGGSTMLSDPQRVMLERSHRTLALYGAAPSLASISAYDFDPRKAQLAVPPTGSRELDASAENLPVVLRDILRRPEAKKRLISLVSVLLPFVHDLDVDEFGFGQLITMLTERFSDKSHRLAAAFASDGTIACLALVVALYFQESAVAVFEEPDKHVHPHLASRVMQMMNEVTDDTQVIVTTHNPELLRHANLEDILLVTRDPDGHSQITRPADSEVCEAVSPKRARRRGLVRPEPTGPVSSGYRRSYGCLSKERTTADFAQKYSSRYSAHTTIT